MNNLSRLELEGIELEHFNKKKTKQKNTIEDFHLENSTGCLRHVCA